MDTRRTPDELPRVALRVAVLYAIVSGLWILLSDRAVAAALSDPALAHLVQTYKGLAFVAVTAVLLYTLLRGELRHWAREAEGRRRAEELNRSLARFPAENPNPVLRIAADGTVLHANEASHALLRGWPLDVGSPAPPVLREVVAAALGRGAGAAIDTEHDGRAFSFFVAPIPRSGYANLYGYDVTDRRRAEEEVRQANADLERRVAERTAELRSAKEAAESSDRVKTAFLASMSHELRTPLNAIIGFSQLMIDGKAGPLGADQREFLGDILTSGRHLLALINDVLDVTRIEADRLELRPEACSVRHVIDETCAVVGAMAAQKEIAIGIEADPADVVTLDPVRFRQVLYNLLSNAVKFTPPRGAVSVAAWIDDRRQVRVRVTDTGIGIRKEDQARLFRPFEQIGSGTVSRQEGTGLGLALTKKIVELQHGSISVESEPGRGSSFTVVLPSAPAGA